MPPHGSFFIFSGNLKDSEDKNEYSATLRDLVAGIPITTSVRIGGHTYKHRNLRALWMI